MGDLVEIIVLMILLGDGLLGEVLLYVWLE